MHLLSSSQFSGAENVVCQIISMMSDQPEVDSFYCSCDGSIRSALKERNVRFVPLTIFSIKEVKRVIHEEKPTIIHAHDRTATFIAVISSGNIPVISHIHFNAVNTRKFSMKSFVYLLSALKAKHIFWVSQSSYEGYIFHKQLEDKSSILYNIIDVESLYKKMEQDSFDYSYDVVFVGRIVEQKDPIRLLDVCRLVVNKKPDAQIAVVGSGGLEEAVRSKAKEIGIINNVSFLGFQANPYKILFDSKAMLMTSKFEGTPMCALEALALGVPIVSTPVDGMKDLIKDDFNGYLSDDNKALADHLISIIDSSLLREKLSNNAKKFSFEHNDIQRYKDEILQAYKA